MSLSRLVPKVGGHVTPIIDIMETELVNVKGWLEKVQSIHDQECIAKDELIIVFDRLSCCCSYLTSFATTFAIQHDCPITTFSGTWYYIYDCKTMDVGKLVFNFSVPNTPLLLLLVSRHLVVLARFIWRR